MERVCEIGKEKQVKKQGDIAGSGLNFSYERDNHYVTLVREEKHDDSRLELV